VVETTIKLSSWLRKQLRRQDRAPYEPAAPDLSHSRQIATRRLPRSGTPKVGFGLPAGEVLHGAAALAGFARRDLQSWASGA
jgi:hypothetical protein